MGQIIKVQSWKRRKDGVETVHHEFQPLKGKDLDKIIFSLLLPTRGRVTLLEENLSKVYSLARNPGTIECFVVTDDDDLETIEFFKTNGIFKNKNIRTFTCPRVGSNNLYLVYRELYLLTVGDIIGLWSDDNIITIKNWDDQFLPHKDKTALIGRKARFLITRKAIEEIELVKEAVNTKFLHADTILIGKYWDTETHISVLTWWARCQPLDQTRIEGSGGGWKLKDESILKHFKLTETFPILA